MTIRDNPNSATGASGAARHAGGSDGNDLASIQFRHFWAVLTQAVAAATSLSEAEGRAGAIALSGELAQMIELHTLEAGRQGGKADVDADLQGRFLKAALADEVLLHTDWAGRGYWGHVQLESVLFGSSQAGNKVFDDLARLLREREPAQRGVARLYLYLLSLGFQGRYRDGPQLAEIAGYRSELFKFVYQRAAGAHERDAVLCEQPYASTLSPGAARRLPKLSRGVTTLLVALLILLLLSQILWLWQSWRVREALGVPLAPAIAQHASDRQWVAPC